MMEKLKERMGKRGRIKSGVSAGVLLEPGLYFRSMDFAVWIGPVY